MLRTLIIFIACLSIFAVGCTTAPKPKIRIAISKASGSENYKKYKQWIKSVDPTIETIDLYGMSYENAVEIVAGVDGLVLSGGPDVHPKYFNKESDTSRCNIDLHRDSLEFEIIKIAQNLEIPIMAICRGEQIFNVARGGSLIIDIPQDVPKSKVVHQSSDSDAVHRILVKRGTLLYKITEMDSGYVNSSHHQCIDKLAKGLEASAISEDKLIEAYSYSNFEEYPFMLAVQWHPERLDYDNPFSYKLAKEFVRNAKYHNLKSKGSSSSISPIGIVGLVLLGLILVPIFLIFLIFSFSRI